MSNGDRKFYVSLLGFVVLYLFSCACALVAFGKEPPAILWAGIANFAGALMALLPAFSWRQPAGHQEHGPVSARAIEDGKEVKK